MEVPDIYREATLVIDQHGDEAGTFAARRVDQLLDDGDLYGSAVWRRVLWAIVELQRESSARGGA